MDFVSWHEYARSWSGTAEMAAGVRERLAALGLAAAESHLTEWNYVPVMRDEAGEFTFMNSRMTGNHERYEKAEAVMNGLEGAAFTFGAFALLQDARVDQAHFYTGVSAPWGLFRRSGRPTIKLAAFEAFAEFLGDDAQRLAVDGHDEAGVQVLAVRRGGRLRLGVAHLAAVPGGAEVRVGGLREGARVVSARHLETGGWAPGGAVLEGDVVRVEAAAPDLSGWPIPAVVKSARRLGSSGWE